MNIKIHSKDWTYDVNLKKDRDTSIESLLLKAAEMSIGEAMVRESTITDLVYAVCYKGEYAINVHPILIDIGEYKFLDYIKRNGDAKDFGFVIKKL